LLAFFRNNSINLLNVHYGIHWIAETGGAAFFAIYLLKSGVPVPGVFVSLALILLGRFVIRPVVIGFCDPVGPAGDGGHRHGAECPAVSAFG
jgi:MFS transporter, DHA1 family, inner membrane transport protein